MSTTTNRVHGLDILKALCAFCVIAIHVPFPGMVGMCIEALSWIAVPIFFMITGYFYVDIQNQKRELSQIKKVLLLCVFSNVLYFLWKLFWELCEGSVQIHSLLVQMFNPKSLLKLLAFNQSPFRESLWYFSAILYVLIIIYFLNRVFANNSGRILLIVTPFLLLMNLVFGNYSLLLLQRTFPLFVTRNFLFVGIPYFSLGLFLRKHKNYIAAFNGKHISLILSTLFFAFTTIVELFLANRFGFIANKDHFISTTFLSILVFSAFTSPYWNEKMSFLYNIGRKYSTNIYIFHPIVITILNAFAHRLHICELYVYFRPFVIYFVSILISVLYIRIQSFWCRKFSRHPW